MLRIGHPEGHSQGCELWTQEEAARNLKVSTRYLRASSAPKVLLPSTGVGGKPLVRYDPDALREWWTRNSVTRRYA